MSLGLCRSSKINSDQCTFVTQVFAHLWHAVAWSELRGDSAPGCESSGCILKCVQADQHHWGAAAELKLLVILEVQVFSPFQVTHWISWLSVKQFIYLLTYTFLGYSEDRNTTTKLFEDFGLPLSSLSGPGFGSTRSVWHGLTKISYCCLPAIFKEKRSETVTLDKGDACK